MSVPALARAPHRDRPALTALGEITLTRARAHEACGPARHMLALVLAGACTGPVLWIAPAWAPARLYPDSLAGRMAPGRLIFVTPKRAEDLLWSMEEALRSGAVPLVVADLPAPPALTPVRRLHLAAEAGAATGAATGRAAPLGLLLTPGPGGAAGVESRWHMAPRHRRDTNEWQLERRRARTAPPRAWRLSERDGRLSLHTATTEPSPAP
jgi:protein ImuA